MPSWPSGPCSFTGRSEVRAKSAMIRMKGDHHARTPSCFAAADRLGRLATSWPAERHTAEADGAAQMFSQMSTPAELPGSIAAASEFTSSSRTASPAPTHMSAILRSLPHPGQKARTPQVIRRHPSSTPTGHTDQITLDQIEQRRCDLPVEPAAWELDHNPPGPSSSTASTSSIDILQFG